MYEFTEKYMTLTGLNAHIFKGFYKVMANILRHNTILFIYNLDKIREATWH